MELDESDVVDFGADPAEPADTADKADDPEAADAAPEPREGSLLRRDPRPEATAILTGAGVESAQKFEGGRGKGGLGTTDVADRPRHA